MMPMAYRYTRMQNLNGELYTTPYQNVLTTSSTWSMQLGVRYIF